MTKTPADALLISLDAVKQDHALQHRGARKILVTGRYPASEAENSKILWRPPATSEKCAVQTNADIELAVFNNRASQDRHYHESGTEIYTVLEGIMHIEIEAAACTLSAGDTIVINPGTVHEIKPEGTSFICQVVTANCKGARDKVISPRHPPLPAA